MNVTTIACTICLTGLLFPRPEPPAAGPVCNAGGPYVAECNGPLASVQLDGTGSYEPHGLPLEFKWQIECGNGYLDDPSSPTPTLYHPMTTCSFSCGRVDLIVFASSGASSCGTQVTFQDTTPPAITCPPDTSVLTGTPYDPTVTGFATAVDTCNASPVITWSDAVFPGNEPEETLVVRTWVADDGCQTSTCDQLITIAPYLIVHVDIRVGECPNPFVLGSNVTAGTTVPVTVLGNAFDPTEANPNTVRLSTETMLDEGTVDFIQPVSIALGDSGTPFIGAVCDCHTLGPDGLLDLNLRFSESQMKYQLGLINQPIGTEVPLVVSGELNDGTPFRGVDCVLIQ